MANQQRGRPSKRAMPEPIDDTPDNIAAAIVTTPSKQTDEWRYLNPED